MNKISKPVFSEKEAGFPPLGRRRFLNYAGITMATGALLLAGCKDDDDDAPPIDTLPPAGDTISFTGNDAGIINLLYILEQLQADFYTQVTDNFATAFSSRERQHLTEIRDHEIAHREVLKTALSTDAVPEIISNFSTVSFNDRSSVLNMARFLEDFGVSAYNGVSEYLVYPDLVVLVAKISSVEARHAALIRELLLTGSFANSEVINPSGLDLTRRPRQVMSLAGSYIRNPVDPLPTNW